MNVKNQIRDFYLEKFHRTQMWVDMMNLQEDSPWHREQNVMVHTNMLLDEYYKRFYNNRSDWHRVSTLIACVFHDVGKPKSKVAKFKEGRGHYFAYHGHEAVSAKMWEKFWNDNRDYMESMLKIDETHMRFIKSMIFHHLPFDIKKQHKLDALFEEMYEPYGVYGLQAWIDLCYCDQHGRISDNKDLARVNEFFHRFLENRVNT